MKSIPLLILSFICFTASAQMHFDEFKKSDFYYEFLNGGHGAQQRMEQGKTVIHFKPIVDREADFFIIMDEGVIDYMELKFTREFISTQGFLAKHHFLSFAETAFCDSVKMELKPFLGALKNYEAVRGINFNFEQTFYGRLEEAELKTSQCTFKLDNDPDDFKAVIKWE